MISVGKLNFFSSTGACTATKCPIANRRSPIVAQLYFASVTKMFLMLLFVKVESDSSKLLTKFNIWSIWVQGTFKTTENVNADKNRESFRTIKSSLDGYTLPQTTTGRAKIIATWTAHKVKTKNNVNSSDIVIQGSGVVLPGEIKQMHWKEIIDTQRSLESWSRLGHFIIRSISSGKRVFCDGLCQHRRQFLERTKDLCQRSRWLIILYEWTNNWLSRTIAL